MAARVVSVAFEGVGGHNLLYVGPPGSGKSMLAQRLPGLLPPLTPGELLETSMVHSIPIWKPPRPSAASTSPKP